LKTIIGDGDGLLQGVAAVSQYGEVLTFWQHLAHAGMIEGNYSGVANSTGESHVTAGSNVPAGKLGNSAFLVRNNVSDWWSNGVSLGNKLILGSTSSSDGGGSIISAEEMWNIDTKLDDGKPATGAVISYTNSTRPNCVTTDVTATAVYDVANETTNACTVVFSRSGF
jgi:hypothetical protein